jgi:hypothetical protein
MAASSRDDTRLAEAGEPQHESVDKGTLLTRGRYVEDFRRTLRKGDEYGLGAVPQLVKGVIETGAWQARLIEKTGEVQEFRSFEEFVMTPPLEGLGSSLRRLKHICQDDKEALDAIDWVTGHSQGKRTDLVSNVHEVKEEKRPAGNTAKRALRKLRKDRPDLHQQVIAGKKSPHAAMVEAGFRKKTLTIPADIEGAARRLVKHFDPDELCEAIIEARQRQT